MVPDFEFKKYFSDIGEWNGPFDQGCYLVRGGWFTELFMLIFLLPYLMDGKKERKYGMMTAFAAMMTLVFVNLTVLFILGLRHPLGVFL